MANGIKAGVKGTASLVKKLKVMGPEIEKALKRELVIAGKIVESQAIQLMTSGSKTGRQYLVPGTKRKYTASAPGEHPAVATGNLVKNVISERTATQKGAGFKVDVGTNVKYGAILEKTGRPWLEPAFEITKKENLRAITRGVKNAIDRSKK